jgi:hypothetical protein
MRSIFGGADVRLAAEVALLSYPTDEDGRMEEWGNG